MQNEKVSILSHENRTKISMQTLLVTIDFQRNGKLLRENFAQKNVRRKFHSFVHSIFETISLKLLSDLQCGRYWIRVFNSDESYFFPSVDLRKSR